MRSRSADGVIGSGKVLVARHGGGMLWLLMVQLPFEQVREVSQITSAALPFASVNSQVQIVPLAEQGVVRVGPTTHL